MAEINPEHLLERATRSGVGAGRPRQLDLRRGISDAYYALFHALTAEIGSQTLRDVPAPAVYSFRRGLGHGELRSACEALTSSKTPKPKELAQVAVTSADVRTVAQAFVDLQEERHLADYAHDEDFDLVRLNEAVALARRAISLLRNRAHSPEMACLLVLLGTMSSWR